MSQHTHGYIEYKSNFYPFEQAMAAPPSSIEDESNFMIEEESFGPITFGIIESISKSIDEFFKAVNCSLDVIGNVVNGTDFKKDFEEFKAAVIAVLKNDLRVCKDSDVGLKAKLK